MPSDTIVCFDCRVTKTSHNHACNDYEYRKPNKICPMCQRAMHVVSSSHPIPKKKDNKGWKGYREYFRKYYVNHGPTDLKKYKRKRWGRLDPRNKEILTLLGKL